MSFNLQRSSFCLKHKQLQTFRKATLSADVESIDTFRDASRHDIEACLKTVKMYRTMLKIDRILQHLGELQTPHNPAFVSLIAKCYSSVDWKTFKCLSPTFRKWQVVSGRLFYFGSYNWPLTRGSRSHIL